MLQENDIENIISKYPELIEEGLNLIGRQKTLYGRIMNILFEDKFKRKLIIKIVLEQIADDYIEQILSYDGFLLSKEDSNLRFMLVGINLPPSFQKDLKFHEIDFFELSNSYIKAFLNDKNDKDFNDLFEYEEITSVNPDDLIFKLKSSENYKNFKSILPLKNKNEERAKSILCENLGRLKSEHLKEIITLVDEPYPYSHDGKIIKRPWFGRLLKSNSSIIINEDEIKLNKWFNILSDSKIPVEKRIKTLLNEPNHIKGLNIGFITLMLYILDKTNYSIWFEGQHEGLSILYPQLEKFTGKENQYSIFNKTAKNFAHQYSFEHSELDWIFSTGVYMIPTLTIYDQLKEILKDMTGSIISSSQVKKLLNSKYGTNISSIILSDYCYNRINTGINFNKHIFEYIDHNTYKFLGENYPYTGLIYSKPAGQENEFVVGEWKNGVKVIYETLQVWIGLDQSKYSMEQIFKRQKSSDSTKSILKEFHKELALQLNQKHFTWKARTHSYGISYFCNDVRSFAALNVGADFGSIHYFTGNSNINGLKKANWVTGNDNHGSEFYRIVDEETLNKAITFALKAYEITAKMV